MITCKLCNIELNIMGSHLRCHNLTTDEYLELFPDAKLFDDTTIRRISESASKSASREPKSPETIRKISQSCSASWTEERRRRQSELLTDNKNALGHVHTDEVKQRISGQLAGRELSCAHRQSISNSLMGHKVTEETRQRISASSFGKVMSPEACQLVSEAQAKIWTEERRQLHSGKLTGNKNALGHTMSEDARRIMAEKNSQAMKENWKDPELAKRVSESWNRKPNMPELQLSAILDKHFPGEWTYVGDGQLWVEGKNPDFVNGSRVIEVFGMYWHDPDLFPNRLSETELIAHYKKHGFDCIVFWEYDVWDEKEVVSRVEDKR